MRGAGHRLSTGTLEAAVNTHEDVTECAVVGVEDDYKGHVPIGLVVLNSDVTDESQYERVSCEI